MCKKLWYILTTTENSFPPVIAHRQYYNRIFLLHFHYRIYRGKPQYYNLRELELTVRWRDKLNYKLKILFNYVKKWYFGEKKWGNHVISKILKKTNHG